MPLSTVKHSRGTILMATDFSKPAQRAYTYALKLALVMGSRLILLHVVNAAPGSEAWSKAAHRFLQPLRTHALLELGRMASLAKDCGVKAGHKLLVGIPEDSILRIAEDTRVDLIAMGTHGRTGWDRLQFGSVAAAILRKASCPVFTVHAGIVDDFPTRPRRVKLSRILVAMDFSPSSEAALRSAVMLAKRFKAEAFLVHAPEPSDSSRPAHVHNREFSSHRADRQFQQAVSALQADQFVTDRIVVPGNPVEVILDQAKRVMAELIVMGTHGRRGLQRLVLGSVAESVVRRAGCPVLVVRAAKRPQNL